MPSSQWAPGLTPVALSVWFFRAETFCDVATISRNFSVIKFTNHRQCDNSDLLPLVRFHVQNSGLGFGRPLEFEFQKITRHDSRQLIFHCLCRCLLAPNLLKRFSVCQWWMVNGEFIRFNVIEVSNQLSILVMITLLLGARFHVYFHNLGKPSMFYHTFIPRSWITVLKSEDSSLDRMALLFYYFRTIKVFRPAEG